MDAGESTEILLQYGMFYGCEKEYSIRLGNYTEDIHKYEAC